MPLADSHSPNKATCCRLGSRRINSSMAERMSGRAWKRWPSRWCWAVLAKLTETGPCAQNVLGRLTAMDVATIKGVIDRLTARGLTLPPAADLAADPVAAWAAHAATVAGLLDDPAIAGIAYDGHFGPTTLGETVERFYVFDMLVHRWDLARAAGSDTSFTDAELDRIDESAQSFGPVLYMEGSCRPAVPAASDADRQTRVLATLGRRA